MTRHTMQRVLRDAQGKPSGWLDDFRAACVRWTDQAATFDEASPAWRAFVAKYAPRRSMGVIPDDYDPETSADSPKRGGCCSPPRKQP